MTKQQLHIQAIHRDDTFSLAYCNLSITLAAGQKMTLRDGRIMTKQQLHINVETMYSNGMRSIFNCLAITNNGADHHAT
jgi:hypothetical protein